MHVVRMKSIWRLVATLFQLTPVVVAIVVLSWSDFANGWLRIGLAAILITSTFRGLAFRQLKDRIPPYLVIRSMLIGYAIAGTLCSIGSVLVGGPVGWLGVFFSLRFALWPLRALYRSAITEYGTAALVYERETRWMVALYVIVPICALLLGLIHVELL